MTYNAKYDTYNDDRNYSSKLSNRSCTTDVLTLVIDERNGVLVQSEYSEDELRIIQNYSKYR